MCQVDLLVDLHRPIEIYQWVDVTSHIPIEMYQWVDSWTGEYLLPRGRRLIMTEMGVDTPSENNTNLMS